jgi:hypothetical protein
MMTQLQKVFNAPTRKHQNLEETRIQKLDHTARLIKSQLNTARLRTIESTKSSVCLVAAEFERKTVDRLESGNIDKRATRQLKTIAY